jgi:hypothetical protein
MAAWAALACSTLVVVPDAKNVLPQPRAGIRQLELRHVGNDAAVLQSA